MGLVYWLSWFGVPPDSSSGWDLALDQGLNGSRKAPRPVEYEMIMTPETRAILDQLSAQFDERMAVWQAPDAAEKVACFLAKRGRVSKAVADNLTLLPCHVARHTL